MLRTLQSGASSHAAEEQGSCNGGEEISSSHSVVGDWKWMVRSKRQAKVEQLEREQWPARHGRHSAPQAKRLVQAVILALLPRRSLWVTQSGRDTSLEKSSAHAHHIRLQRHPEEGRSWP